MTEKNHSQFLEHVQKYCELYPEVAPYVTNYVAKGLTATLKRTNDRACDMEAALMFAVQKRAKNIGDVFISEKLNFWKDDLRMNWGAWEGYLKEIKK